MENLNDIADEIQNMTGDMYEGTITMSEDAFHEYANRIREAAERDREMWRGRVMDALAVADQFKGALDHVLNGLLFAQQKKGGPDGNPE
jgi:hypothetical protein